MPRQAVEFLLLAARTLGGDSPEAYGASHWADVLRYLSVLIFTGVNVGRLREFAEWIAGEFGQADAFEEAKEALVERFRSNPNALRVTASAVVRKKNVEDAWRSLLE